MTRNKKNKEQKFNPDDDRKIERQKKFEERRKNKLREQRKRTKHYFSDDYDEDEQWN
jgi:hypothetical protein